MFVNSKFFVPPKVKRSGREATGWKVVAWAGEDKIAKVEFRTGLAKLATSDLAASSGSVSGLPGAMTGSTCFRGIYARSSG